ncbi:MAG: hypothetical protein JJ992_07695, partial [Planctomycetes bacterium]|nr:hypothetical protein [Planctomycetota bacterium]
MTSTHPTHQHPVLLFPLRLETRYDGSDLLLRIYPDDVLVHAHDERISPAESLALQEYVDARRTDGVDDFAAWRG